MAQNHRGRVTLSDIADTCNLAVSTVSRALSTPERVSQRTRERVQRAATELGYERVHTGDRDGTRGTVALLVPNMDNPYILDLVRGVTAQCQASGFDLTVANFSESVQVEVDLLRSLARRVTGIAISSPRSPNDVLAEVAAKIPTVIINRTVPTVPAVVVDTAEGLRAAVDLLIAQGHRSLTYVRGPGTTWTDKQRSEAVEAACRERDVDLTFIGPFLSTLPSGRAAADSLLSMGAGAAIFFNDVLAIGALGRFRELGIGVPSDISIVGCGDIFGASCSEPPLTTVTIPGEPIGRAAADMLITTLTETATNHVLRFAPRLTVRESTGPAATNS